MSSAPGSPGRSTSGTFTFAAESKPAYASVRHGMESIRSGPHGATRQPVAGVSLERIWLGLIMKLIAGWSGCLSEPSAYACFKRAITPASATPREPRPE
jgi:hypothetical protein